MEVRLSDFKGKELEFFLDVALYQKIKVETKIEEYEEDEPLFQNEWETDPYGIVQHSYCYENKDFQSIKEIFFSEVNNFHYCPYCDKSVPIIYKGRKLEEGYQNPKLSHGINIDSQEKYEEYKLYAQTEFEKRFNFITSHLFDKNGTLSIQLECTAKEKHIFNVFFKFTEDNYIVKVGQFPSAVSMDNANKRYKKAIKDRTTIAELNRAIGLKAHGVGVGSFVYLRRIFEKLIFTKFEEYLKDNLTFERKLFLNQEMSKKIDFLKDYLPSSLVDNKLLYSILSKGIHELSEKDCLDYFDIVYGAIIIILEEKLEIEQKNKRQQEVQKAINKIHSNLK